jgi:peptidyl-prolyl cis-trans isomerase D
MFDAVAKHKRIVQIILALITLPFAFFGVDYYFRRGDAAGEVATFDGGRISKVEFDNALRDQQEMLRRTQRAVDPALFDNPEVRYSILQNVIRDRMIEKKGADLHFAVSNEQVFERIASDPRFQEDGKFSLDKFKLLLAQAGIPEAAYENSVRQQLLQEKVVEPIAAGGIVAKSAGEGFVKMLEQQREVAVATVDAAPFVKDVKVDDAAVRAFYDANTSAFRTPEEVKFEYLVLTPDALGAQVTVTPDEVKAQYAASIKQYTRNEERDAAHILIAVKPDASDADKAAAKKKAEDLAARAKANPAKFAELAKQYSEDPGSAGQGGDLGSNPRGTMVKPFEDAVFAMKPGEIVGPVQSEFGFHVIKLLGITPARTLALDEAKGAIEADLKRQKVSQKFAAAADQFQNLVYEQADSLDGVAKALNLEAKTSQWATRADAQRLAFGNAKFVQALFAPESVTAKRNTEAIEVAPNTLMAGRVIEYKPAAPRPFDEVKDEIRRQLVEREASEMAQKLGREKLALLEQGKTDKEAGVTFGKPVSVLRNQMQPGFSADALTGVFRVDAAKLPQYVGAANEHGGYSIYRVQKTMLPPTATDPSKLAAARSRIAELQSRELFDAYIALLKAKADLRINQANLEKK